MRYSASLLRRKIDPSDTAIDASVCRRACSSPAAETLPRRDHGRNTFFVRNRSGRRRQPATPSSSAQTLHPSRCPCFRIEARRDAVVADEYSSSPTSSGDGVGGPSLQRPRDVRPGDVARAVGPDRQQIRLVKARGDETSPWSNTGRGTMEKPSP